MKRVVFCYVQALFLVLGDKLDILKKEVESLLDFFKYQPDIFAFLSNPIIATERKKEILLCMKQCFDERLINFIIVICVNKRFSLIFSILEEFLRVVRKNYNELEITIKSAFPLRKADIQIITKSLNFLGKIIKVNNIVDSSILGGFIIRYDFNLIDLSLESYLEKLVDLSKIEILKHKVLYERKYEYL